PTAMLRRPERQYSASIFPVSETLCRRLPILPARRTPSRRLEPRLAMAFAHMRTDPGLWPRALFCLLSSYAFGSSFARAEHGRRLGSHRCIRARDDLTNPIVGSRCHCAASITYHWTRLLRAVTTGASRPLNTAL